MSYFQERYVNEQYSKYMNFRQNRRILLDNSTAKNVYPYEDGFMIYAWGFYRINPNETVEISMSPAPGQKIISGGYSVNSPQYYPTIFSNLTVSPSTYLIIMRNSHAVGIDIVVTIVAKN
ncbi:hypothetical protein [Paenibacillus sp. FSL K6-1230]|uniref:hypothetical protein n=1 Tax=Paenibacillus sp. FSL K6-1230 TaxID=2921603 RepID=UPI0030F64891